MTDDTPTFESTLPTLGVPDTPDPPDPAVPPNPELFMTREFPPAPEIAAPVSEPETSPPAAAKPPRRKHRKVADPEEVQSGPVLSAQTRAEMEAGRAVLRRYAPVK